MFDVLYVTLCILGNSHAFVVICWVNFLSKVLFFSKNYYRSTMTDQVSNSMDPDQEQHSGSKLFAKVFR